MSDIIRELEKEQLRTDLPKLEVGDTVRVFVKVVEGSRERLQNFEGIVIKMQGGGVRKTFTVRRVSYGVGVERTFPYNSPRIGRIEVVRHGKVRRAKLYYLRDRSVRPPRWWSGFPQTRKNNRQGKGSVCCVCPEPARASARARDHMPAQTQRNRNPRCMAA